MVIAIVGCAQGWKEDLDTLKELTSVHAVAAVGLDCPYEGRIKYFATYHTADIVPFYNKRRQLGLNQNYQIISHFNISFPNGLKANIVIPYKKPSGSSALLAVFGMLKEGYDKIVLCGCPLEGKNDKNYSYTNFHKGWKNNKELIQDKVRSMSGWTKSFLGFPTKEWLER